MTMNELTESADKPVVWFDHLQGMNSAIADVLRAGGLEVRTLPGAVRLPPAEKPAAPRREHPEGADTTAPHGSQPPCGSPCESPDARTTAQPETWAARPSPIPPKVRMLEMTSAARLGSSCPVIIHIGTLNVNLKL